MGQIVNFQIPIDCTSMQQADIIADNIDAYTRGANGQVVGLPGGITASALKALAKHRDKLTMIAQKSAKGGKTTLLMHAGDIMAFVNDIVKG